MHKEVIGSTEFTFRIIPPSEQLEEVFCLRYKVYCKERQFIKEEDCPEGKETDQYDPHSLQFAIEDKIGLIGTARLILDSSLGFPLEEHCQGQLHVKEPVPRTRIAEISRLVISKEYRRRSKDGLYYSPEFVDKANVSGQGAAGSPAQRMRPMVFGLYREIYQESKRRGITHWYALMEKSLWHLLNMHGFPFHPIGEVIEFYGPVSPYIASISEIEEAFRTKYPELFYDYFLAGLKEEYQPEFAGKYDAGAVSQGIFEAFMESVHANPKRTAISFKKGSYHSITYFDLSQQAVQLGNVLSSRGLKELDRVVLLEENGPEWARSFLAVQYNKAIAVPVDTSFTPEDIVERINFCRPAFVLCQQSYFHKLFHFVEKNKEVHVIIIDSAEFQRELEHASGEIPSGRKPTFPRQAALFFYTSGTTNTPKAVMLSHKNLVSNVNSVNQLDIARKDDVFISMLPLYHSYSFMATFLLPLLKGCQVSYPASLNSEDLLECIKETQVSVLAGVPQIFLLFHSHIAEKFKLLIWWKKIPLKLLVEFFWFIRKLTRINLNKFMLNRLHKRFGKRLRYMISGGARLEPKVINDFFKWGFTILEGYGLTEASPIVTWNPPERVKIGSVGKPLPGVEVKIFNSDRQGAGEIVFKGPNVMLGYYQLPEETYKATIEGWYLSGDVGYLDKDNYLYLVARKDDLIVLSSGKKVSPEEIEKHYSRSPSVKEICVFASDASSFVAGTKQLAAVVVANEDYLRSQGIINIEERLKWEFDNLSQLLPNFKRITGFVVAKDPFPRTALGKVMRHKVEAQLKTSWLAKDHDGLASQDEQETILMREYQPLLDYLTKRFHKKVGLKDHLELDLGLDSLSRVELLLHLQQFFLIKIPDEFMSKIFYANTVKELAQEIKPFLPKEMFVSHDEKTDWKNILSKPPAALRLKEIDLTQGLGAKALTLGYLVFLRTICKVFFRLKVKNASTLPAEGAYIIYGNHSSYLDGGIVAASIPLGLAQETFFVGFRKFVSHPLFKGVLRVSRFVAIDTSHDLVESLQLCAHILRNRKVVVFFPEGQRSIDGEVKGFKGGIGILAKELDIPLVPVYIDGAFRSWPRNQLLPKPTKITVTFGRAIRLKGEESYESATEQLRQELLKLRPRE